LHRQNETKKTDPPFRSHGFWFASFLAFQGHFKPGIVHQDGEKLQQFICVPESFRIRQALVRIGAVMRKILQAKITLPASSFHKPGKPRKRWKKQ